MDDMFNQPTKILFALSPAGDKTILCLGTLCRILKEMQLLSKNKRKYHPFKPTHVFSGSGGDINAYIAGIYKWNADDYTDENGKSQTGIINGFNNDLSKNDKY